MGNSEILAADLVSRERVDVRFALGEQMILVGEEHEPERELWVDGQSRWVEVIFLDPPNDHKVERIVFDDAVQPLIDRVRKEGSHVAPVRGGDVFVAKA